MAVMLPRLCGLSKHAGSRERGSRNHHQLHYALLLVGFEYRLFALPRGHKQKPRQTERLWRG
jgi:hypothetical protein